MPKPEEVIKSIKRAGGLVFIPHTYVYGEHSDKILNELISNYDIDGIECYYPLFTDKQTEFLVNLCKEKGLYISGGSDYHGKTKKNELGKVNNGKLIIDENINTWIEKTSNI